jgi:ankyrin repeat protein
MSSKYWISLQYPFFKLRSAHDIRIRSLACNFFRCLSVLCGACSRKGMESCNIFLYSVGTPTEAEPADSTPVSVSAPARYPEPCVSLQGWTALMAAARNSHDMTVKLLLDHSAAVDVKNNYVRACV